MARPRKLWLAPSALAVAGITALGLVAAPSAVAADALDTTGPTVTVKPESVGADGVFRTVSFKLNDASKVDRLTLNGVEKDLTNNVWSDLNGVKPGTFGAVEGVNTLVVLDALGNATTLTFTLDTTGPTVTVKPESVGADGVFRTVSFKLNDVSKVDRLTLNGVEKDLTNNVWSDLNGVKPGSFGAVEGKNTLVVLDALGNATTLTFTLDTTGPAVTVKPESVGADGVYRSVSFKLNDPSKVDRLTLNGVEKDLTNNVWSDLNGVKPGSFGAVEGVNTLVVFDVLGNATTLTFTLDTTGPAVTVKPESVGADGVYRSVSFKLNDASKVDRLTLNGVEKDLTNNVWSDLNGVKPGSFGAVEGVNTLVVLDVLGNATTLTFTLDTIAPAVTIPSGVVTIDGEHTFDLSQVEANPDWSYVEIDQIGTDGKWKKISGQRFEDTNDLSYAVDAADLEVGVRTQVKITSVDVAGNRSGASFDVSVVAPAPVADEVPATVVEKPAKATGLKGLIQSILRLLAGFLR